tara:strand:+ start:1978 stop:2409 length:432 start_codon:yes stop_codon:yes gene_type:complete
MITNVTDKELESYRADAIKLANELNALFRQVPIRQLLRFQKLSFVYHPEVSNGNLGAAYKEGTEHWVKHGALEQLMDMLNVELTPANEMPKFGAGSFGSVWFDTELTGGIGDKKRTKTVRVCPRRNESGGFDILLDNTFDEVW